MFETLNNWFSGAQRTGAPLPAMVPVSPAEFADQSSDVCRSVTSKRVASVPQAKGQPGAVILALLAAGRPCSVSELARLMGVSVSESSRRVKAAGKRVKCERVGKFKMVRLAGKAKGRAQP